MTQANESAPSAELAGGPFEQYLNHLGLEEGEKATFLGYATAFLRAGAPLGVEQLRPKHKDLYLNGLFEQQTSTEELRHAARACDLLLSFGRQSGLPEADLPQAAPALPGAAVSSPGDVVPPAGSSQAGVNPAVAASGAPVLPTGAPAPEVGGHAGPGAAPGVRELLLQRERRLWRGLAVLPVIAAISGFPIAFFIVFFVNPRPEELGLLWYLLKAYGSIVAFCLQFGLVGLLGAAFVGLRYRRRVAVLSRQSRLVPVAWDGERVLYGVRGAREGLAHLIGGLLAYLLELLLTPVLKLLDNSLPVWSVRASCQLEQRTVHIQDVMYGDELVLVDHQAWSWAIMDPARPEGEHFLLRVGDEALLSPPAGPDLPAESPSPG